MWITFKICTFVISNNFIKNSLRTHSVVNYFQNLYLCDFQQPQVHESIAWVGCELLSKFVPLWFPTTDVTTTGNQNTLWITFKICTFVISNNTLLLLFWQWHVVNYFQNLYLCDFQQLSPCSPAIFTSCELLSKFVPLWFPTTCLSR